jgi:hypothetical protein
MAEVGERRAAMVLRALVYGALALPLALGGAATLVCASYTPAQLGAGAHWARLGWSPAACPGCALCGMTRAFSAVLHGDVALALDYNPMVMVMFPAVMIATAVAAWALFHFSRHPLRLEPRCLEVSS